MGNEAGNKVGRLESVLFQRWATLKKDMPTLVGVWNRKAVSRDILFRTQFRVGWYFDHDFRKGMLGDRFKSEGEFFRATLDEALYR